mmetsp:Transcript_119092/g.336874  ORF Transcript_119092/g.336874 Transcript_119092/m.336874 type:complete len:88 (+) Transcript_119092:1500-1763(+)
MQQIHQQHDERQSIKIHIAAMAHTSTSKKDMKQSASISANLPYWRNKVDIQNAQGSRKAWSFFVYAAWWWKNMTQLVKAIHSNWAMT